MSSSSKREENEEKLLQSARRGDLDTVLVSKGFIVFMPTEHWNYRYGFQPLENKLSLVLFILLFCGLFEATLILDKLNMKSLSIELKI